MPPKPTPERFRTYAEFWPYYLREHSHPRTRLIHVAGTTMTVLLFVALVASCHLAWLPVCLLTGYGPAWYAHFFVEKNRPATFTYPWWSFISDFKMTYLFYRGRLKP